MNQLIKPPKLRKGEMIATVTITNGCSEDRDIK